MELGGDSDETELMMEHGLDPDKIGLMISSNEIELTMGLGRDLDPTESMMELENSLDKAEAELIKMERNCLETVRTRAGPR